MISTAFAVNKTIYPECGPGWNDIIQNAVKMIDGHVSKLIGSGKAGDALNNFEYSQIKEKYGGLRIYVSFEDDYIHGVIDMAEAMSYTVCENTGKPGTICIRGGWLKTLCLEEAAKNDFRPYSVEDRMI